MNTPSVVDAFYSRIWNAGDIAAINEIITEDFVFRGSLGIDIQGRERFREYVAMVRGALADYHCAILECVAEDDRVFAKMRFSGRHAGVFRGFAPTGKQVEWLGAALFTLKGSRISAVWVLGDLVGLNTMLEGNAR